MAGLPSGGAHPGFYWGGPGAGQPGVNAACVNCLSDGTMPDLFQLRVNGLDSTVVGLQNPAAAIKTQAYANMDGLGSLLDRAQTGLDLAGLVPAIGTAADILNAGISLARGNTEDVLWSLAAAVPAGGLAVGAAKITRRAARTGLDDLVSNSKFWSRSDFRGTRVFQRNDMIDPKLVDARGRTNLQRMQKGLAPIGPDGKSLSLHHMTQMNNSSLAELTATFHQQNSKVIHINPNTIPSGIDRKAFDAFRRAYWINHANSFSP